MALPAGTKIFTDAGQAGNWADPMNWQGGVAAAWNSLVLIPTNAVLNGSFSVRQLMILGQEVVTVNGSLSTLSDALCKSMMVCANAVVTFTPTSSLNDRGGLVVGNISTGTLIAQGNATMRSSIATVSLKLGQAAAGTGYVTVDGAHWVDSQNALVGMVGAGTLTVTNGGYVSVGSEFVDGDFAGATGHVVLTNGGTIAIAGHAKIGGSSTTALAGTGSLSVGVGSLFSVAAGLKITTTGSVTLSGGTVASLGAQETQVWGKASVTGFGTFSSMMGISDSGTITATGGTLTLNGTAITGPGKLNIASGSTAVLNTATIGKVAIAFTGSNATLALAHGVSSMATISGFEASDRITIPGVDHLDWNSAAGVLTLSENNVVLDKLHIAGTFAADPFTLSQDATGALATIQLHH